MANICEFRDPNANIVVQGDTWLCCNRKIKNEELVDGYQHLCNNTQNDSFCNKHKGPNNYLFTLDKIVFPGNGYQEELYQMIIN